MAKNYPETNPFTGALADAYARGWNHGHGIACHNVPELGATVWCDTLGRVTVGADNIRSYSPFEFTAHEFNESEDSEALWSAFDQGIADAIAADLAEYTDEDYRIEA